MPYTVWRSADMVMIDADDGAIRLTHEEAAALAQELLPAALDEHEREIEADCVPLDPRDPDPSREGFWRYHNCWKCREGEKPCPNGGLHHCEYPHARND